MVTASIFFYILVFLSVYVQVFFLITFFENRKKIIIRTGETKLKEYPAVTVIVPCWNEEKTVVKTVQSLLALNYPKEKLNLFLVDDGSTDNTWEEILKFKDYSNIKIFQKENGGKHTALNLGLKNIQTEFLGCLDADSETHPEALSRIMSYFEEDPSIMAVAPTIVTINSKNIIQYAQKVEYDMSAYMKKMLGLMGAIHVTPGPFTIFRKKVFDDLGPYREAHNTEDMEIAYRMQKNRYKIEQCNDAYVYTNTPPTIKKLYRQRLRWIYGFINNTIDYRHLILKKKYGNFSIFTLPSGIISIFTASYLFGKAIYSLVNTLISKFSEYNLVGFHFMTKNNFLDPYFFNTQSLFFVAILLYALIIFSVVLGRKMTENKTSLSINIIYFILVFSVIGPFWMLKAIYNTLLARGNPAWR